MDENETILAFGGELKALGDGRFGGYLVRFTSEDDPDLTGDFFTAETDFDMDFPGKSTVYWNHGIDAKVGKRKLGKADLTIDGVGVWAETILQERDEYEEHIAQWARAGKLGWSSSTAPNLMERKKVGNAEHIVLWPVSYTHLTLPTTPYV